MNNRLLTAQLAALSLFGLLSQAHAQLLGSANSFAVLAGSTVTNTGSSVLSGNLGVWPGTAITGFPPGIVTNGSTYSGDAVAMQAEKDLTTAYNSIASESYNVDLTGQDLGSYTLTPGVYHFDSSATLTGPLILNAQGDPNARFDFQIGSTLITATGASVTVINGGSCNVYWQVGSSATLGTGTDFLGHILAADSITLDTGASIVHGGAFAETAAVTLDSNSISTCAAPEPAPTLVLGIGLAGLLLRKARRA